MFIIQRAKIEDFGPRYKVVEVVKIKPKAKISTFDQCIIQKHKTGVSIITRNKFFVLIVFYNLHLLRNSSVFNFMKVKF